MANALMTIAHAALSGMLLDQFDCEESDFLVGNDDSVLFYKGDFDVIT